MIQPKLSAPLPSDERHVLGFIPSKYPAGDTVARRKGGHIRWGEPAGVVELIVLDTDVSPRIVGKEPDHEGIGSGPGLTAEVTNVLHFHPDLFLYLPVHAILEAFPDFHKPRDKTVELGYEPAVVG